VERPNIIYIAPNNFKIQKKLLKIAKLTSSKIASGIHEFDLKE